MPKKAAPKKATKAIKKTAKKISKVVRDPKISQLSIQIWVAVTAVAVLLVVMFYQMMTHTLVEKTPNFLSPDQEVKPIPIEQAPQPTDNSNQTPQY